MDRFSIDEKVFETKLNYVNIAFHDIVLNPLQCCIKSPPNLKYNNLVIWQYTITKVFVNIGYDVYGAIVNNLNGMKVYLQIRKV